MLSDFGLKGEAVRLEDNGELRNSGCECEMAG